MGTISVANVTDLKTRLATLVPGDTIVLADGTYPGSLILKAIGTGQGAVRIKSGTAGNPITMKAANPGKAVIDGGADALSITGADYWVIEGIVAQNATNRGIYISGGSNIRVSNVKCLRNGITGLLASDSPDLIVEDGEFAFNAQQHGIYYSRPADRPIIRRNRCHDNGRCGIQVNAQGDAGTHPVAVPARTSKALVEGNECWNNGGTSGVGSAINFIQIVDSVVRGNNLHDNLGGGVALDVCSRILVEGNTIKFQKNKGKQCITAVDQSKDNTARNNVCVMGKSNVPALYRDPNSELKDGGGNSTSVAT